MKKIIFILAIITTLMAGIILTGYRLSAQKQKVANAKLLYTKGDLNAVRKDENAVVQKPVNAEEWITFKSESERKIRDHEIRIAELFAKLEKQGEISDAHYKKKIANLEQQNKYLSARLVNFEKGPSNWESFKHGFKHDMDAIENALKDLTVDNKN
jgi:hypothetical protein